MTTHKQNSLRATTAQKVRIAFVVPHIFIHRDILGGVIFSPGKLAIDLCEELQREGVEITLFAPGPVATSVPTITADLSLFETELTGRGDSYLDLLKKHPFTFISLARQVQSEIIAKAYKAANEGKFDLVHIYTNEEDIALPFAQFCNAPVVFTHHDPFNFLVKYKNVFPKYKQLNWISISLSQREGMPRDTNWIGNIYHGLKPTQLQPVKNPRRNYVAFLGRIIEPKGVHHAIEAVRQYNQLTGNQLVLKIAGKHYAGHSKDTYWQEKIEPYLGEEVEYVGHISSDKDKQAFLGNAKALLVPSTFSEPFGMVTIEALACDTPVIGLEHGATAEIINNGKTGFIARPQGDETIAAAIAHSIIKLDNVIPGTCRQEFLSRFTLERMAHDHEQLYLRELAKTVRRLKND